MKRKGRESNHKCVNYLCIYRNNSVNGSTEIANKSNNNSELRVVRLHTAHEIMKNVSAFFFLFALFCVFLLIFISLFFLWCRSLSLCHNNHRQAISLQASNNIELDRRQWSEKKTLYAMKRQRLLNWFFRSFHCFLPFFLLQSHCVYR